MKDSDGSTDAEPNWQASLPSTELAKLHLARAFLMYPEVLICQRPLSHFVDQKAITIMQHLKQFVSNRGLCFPEGSTDHRRPRTMFFTAEAIEQAADASQVWCIRPNGEMGQAAEVLVLGKEDPLFQAYFQDAFDSMPPQSMPNSQGSFRSTSPILVQRVFLCPNLGSTRRLSK